MAWSEQMILKVHLAHARYVRDADRLVPLLRDASLAPQDIGTELKELARKRAAPAAPRSVRELRRLCAEYIWLHVCVQLVSLLHG